MTDIVFYDFDFNRLRDFPNPISVNIEKCYCGYGCAELHFAICEQDLIHLLENNEYLFFIMGDCSVIVTGWQLGEDIAVYGRTPEWLFTKRGVKPLAFNNINAEVIARNIVASISDFVTLGKLSNVGEATDYSTEDVRNLYDVVCEVLQAQKLGFEVFPDVSRKQFVFRVYEGKESLCMFSTSNRTAYDMQYSVEKQNVTTNSGWYKRRYKDMGSWDAELNLPYLTNNHLDNAYTFYKVTSCEATNRFGLSCAQGMYLYCDNLQGTWKISEVKPDAIWLYINNAEKTGTKKWDAVLSGIKTEEEARLEIAQMAVLRDTSCEVYRLEYQKAYQLGDIVRVQLEFGDFKKSEQKRVTSVNIYYDVDRTGVIPRLSNMEE